MKRSILILSVVLLLSCTNVEEDKSLLLSDLTTFTKNSKKPGQLIKDNLKSKSIVILNYPEYASESYNFIKFIAALMNIDNITTVVYLGLPELIEGEEFTELMGNKNPMLGFREFESIIDYFNKENINFIGQLPNDNNKVLILAPADNYEKTRELVYSTYSEENILKVVLAGSSYTVEYHELITELPASKKVSAIQITDNIFDIMVITGDVENYTPVEAIKLYTVENYENAPENFLQENRSLFESLQIKKMNNALPKLIKNSFK